MNVEPFKYHSQGPLRHPTFDCAGLDLYNDFLILIACMEVRWLMIVVVHENDDAVEATDFWISSIGLS